MYANLAPTVSLDFLDGYLFRVLQEIAAEKGLDESGLYNYYGHRLASRIGGLQEYEAALARHLLALKPARVVHAGIGVGTLTAVLASNGIPVVGIEADGKRAATAGLVRAALATIWPEIRYQVVTGFYPDVLPDDAGGPDAVLVFTNVGAGWDDAALNRVIASLPRFGEAYFDLRLFGSVRETEEERVALFNRIAATGRFAERLPHVLPGIHLARFVFGSARQ